MCGIAGIVSKSNSSGLDIRQLMYRMSRALAHRGPDGEGFVHFQCREATPLFSDHTPAVNKESRRFRFNAAANILDHAMAPASPTHLDIFFAHRRLSIIDLSEAGHQPMCDHEGNFWITYNGELYNYLELRRQLEALGYVFVTNTDTEVILNAYRHWGTDCLRHFNGMWAFALYDLHNHQLFCARDRVGVKPFYFVNTKELFAFASEHKAFIKSGLLAFEPDEQQEMDFIVAARIEHQPQGLFRHITELAPAHYLLYDTHTHQLNHERYDSPAHVDERDPGNEKELIARIRAKLIDAVNIRLRSDVEVGSCLSGGIDSSVLAGIMHHLHPQQELKLFTSIFPDERFDESNFAALVARSVNGKWGTVSPAADDFYRDIRHLNYHQDLPIWSTSTYSQYRVMKLASEAGIKVLLDGQGADEIFSGYTHHYLSYWKELIAKGQYSKARHEVRAARETLPQASRALLRQYARDLVKPSQHYDAYLNTGEKQTAATDSIYTGLNKQLRYDYAGGRLKSYLKCEDRCSMAFGIESRVPFADDVELVNELFSVPSSYKIQDGTLKYLLREAAKDFLPAQIYYRKDKTGFETPQGKWLQHGRNHIIDTIAQQLNYVQADALKKDFEKLVNSKPYFVLRLYSLAVWREVFSGVRP